MDADCLKVLQLLREAEINLAAGGLRMLSLGELVAKTNLEKWQGRMMALDSSLMAAAAEIRCIAAEIAAESYAAPPAS